MLDTQFSIISDKKKTDSGNPIEHNSEGLDYSLSSTADGRQPGQRHLLWKELLAYQVMLLARVDIEFVAKFSSLWSSI